MTADVFDIKLVFPLTGDQTAQQISSLEYITNCQLLCCTVSGDIIGIDTRSKNSKVSQHRNCGSSDSYWTMSNCSSQSESLLKMSSRGEVIQLDKRCLNDKVIVSNIEVSSDHNLEMLCIQVCVFLQVLYPFPY